MKNIIDAFGQELERDPCQITPEIIAAVEQEDLTIDGQTDFARVTAFAKKLGIPTSFRPNTDRKAAHVAAGKSCSDAEKIRRVSQIDRYRGEVRTLVFADGKGKIPGAVALHMPSEIAVSNSALRQAVKVHCNGTILWSPSKMKAADPQALNLNGLGHLGNGLFNPITFPSKANILHIFDSSMRDESAGTWSTNAGTRAVGQIFVPRDMADTIISYCATQAGDEWHAVYADIGKHNIEEI